MSTQALETFENTVHMWNIFEGKTKGSKRQNYFSTDGILFCIWEKKITIHDLNFEVKKDNLMNMRVFSTLLHSDTRSVGIEFISWYMESGVLTFIIEGLLFVCDVHSLKIFSFWIWSAVFYSFSINKTSRIFIILFEKSIFQMSLNNHELKQKDTHGLSHLRKYHS